jgi:hypothetical protein
MPLSNIYFKNTERFLIIDFKYCEIRHEYVLFPIIVNGFLNSKSKEHVCFKNNWDVNSYKNKKVFIFKNCNIPRFKLKDKLNKTILIDKADYCFINTENLIEADNIVDVYKNVAKISYDNFIDLLVAIIDVQSKTILNSVKNLVDVDNIYITENVYNEYESHDTVVVGYLRNFNFIRWCSYNKRKNPSIIGINNKIDFNVPIFNQNDVLKIINEEQIIINDEKYEELRALANSPDKDNFLLMISIIENSNFEESFANLVFLIVEFKDLITTEIKNRVAFKSLLSYLGFDFHTSKHLSIYYPTKALKDKKLFNQKNADKLKELFEQKYFYYDQNTLNFWYRGVDGTPHYLVNMLDKC